MRAEADEVETRLRGSDIMVHDEALQAYLDSVVARLLPHLSVTGTAPRPVAIRDPFLNAAALPNGLFWIHTGMLATLENEAQLATVVAHELEHYAGRHALRGKIDADRRKSTRDAVAGLSTIFSPIPGIGIALLIGVHEMDKADPNVYSRELEREADAAGVRAMIAAGYDASQALRTYELFLAEENEGDAKEPYGYGSHPESRERLASCRAELEKLHASASPSGGGRTAREEYETAIRGILLSNSELDLSIKRYERAEQAAARYVRLQPADAKGHLALARVLQRKSGHNRVGLESAAAEYERAVQLDPRLAAARRELGLLSHDLGRREETTRHLEAYLSLEPRAVDRPILESYLR